MKKLISVVIPAYNEEDVLDELKKQLERVMDNNKQYDFEIIIVENGSFDSSINKLLEINKINPRFKIIQLSRNFGPDGGITAGMSYAKGDATVIMNADLQDPPEMISKFINKWEEGYEIVYGIIITRNGISYIRKILSSLAYIIINRFSNSKIPRNAGDFRLIDKKVCQAVNQMNEKNRYLRGIIAWTGFRQIGIPYERPARFAGKSKAGFATAMEVAINGLLSFSYFPLKIAIILGFTISIVSFILMLIEIALYMLYGREVPGYTSTILIVLFLFGVLFLLMGILGMYVERIYDEVKQRPNYIVKEKIGFD